VTDPISSRLIVEAARLAVHSRTRAVVGRLWRCPRCAEPDEYPDDIAECSCEDDGSYYELPVGAELRPGGRHLL